MVLKSLNGHKTTQAFPAIKCLDLAKEHILLNENS